MAIIWALLLSHHSALYNDELLFLGNARRIAQGALPHKSYFQFIPTAAEFVLAPWLSLWPKHPLSVAHALNALVVLWVAALSYWLPRRLGLSVGLALLPAAFWLWGVVPHWPVWGHHALAWWGILMALCSVAPQPARARAWFQAGLGLGVAGLSLHLDGALALLAMLLWRWTPVAEHLGAAPERRKQLGALVLGMGLVFLPYPLVLALGGGLAAFIEQVLLWPIGHYRQPGGFNDVSLLGDLAAFGVGEGPGAWLRWAHAHALLAVVVLGAACAALSWWRSAAQTAHSEGAHALRLLALVALGLGWGASHGRTDLTHVAMYAPCAALALTVAAAHRPQAWVAKSSWLLVGLVAATGGAWQLALMRAKPGLWLSLASPDARVGAHPAHRWAEAHIRPNDGVVAAPYGGYVYMAWGVPQSHHAILLPPDAGYLSPADWQSNWQRIAMNRPKWIVFDLCEGSSTYLQAMPPGYRWVKELPSPLYGASCPWRIYERQDVWPALGLLPLRDVGAGTGALARPGHNETALEGGPK